MCENPIRCLSDPGYDDLIGVQLSEVLFSMTRSDIDASCAYGAGEFHVMRMISDAEGPLQIDAMFGGGLVEKMRVGLDAGATVGSLMGTDVNVRNRHTMPGEVRHDPGIHLLQALHRDEAPGHP